MIQHSYLPNTQAQREEMLQAIGVGSVEELFSDIPVQFRNPTLDLPPALSEMELLQELASLAEENLTPGDYSCFLGGGVYRHFVPSIVGAMVSRGELLTSYTPYQPEVSQGTLQATYDYQTLICLLTGMEVANAGMYEGATALAEAALMACRVTERFKVAILDTVNPRSREVVASYAAPQGIQVVTVPSDRPEVDAETACLVAQYPTFLGAVPDLGAYEKAAHSKEALLVVSAYPTALGMFKPPGEYGADIVTGESQPLGVALSYGGPYVGFFACRQRFLRQMPGRIVGKTVDSTGRPGYVLTLQTREQHIRREGATSNICTSEALIATATAVYMAALGPRGLRQVAELCYQKAHYAASLIAQVPGYAILPGGRAEDGSGAVPWFNEFVAQCPVPPAELNRRLRGHRILGGLDVSDQTPNGMLFCVTETNSRREIEALAAALAEVGG
jgi:glycine dehydrogenase subunit 1